MPKLNKKPSRRTKTPQRVSKVQQPRSAKPQIPELPRGARGRIRRGLPEEDEPRDSRKGGLTVPARMAAVMGDRVMAAGELMQDLEAAGEKFQSKDMRSYVSTTLNSQLRPVIHTDGKRYKVHYFTCVKRGQYRVATLEDIQREILQLEPVSEPRPRKGASSARNPTIPNTPAAVIGAVPGFVTFDAMALRTLICAVLRDELKTILKSELQALLRSGIGV